MKILITGNLGYVGPAVVRQLRRKIPSADLIGFDSGFFAHSLSNVSVLPEHLLSRQIFGDVRDLDAEILSGVDAVVHLAAVSNDPMGNQFEAVTEAINLRSSVRIAEIARQQGVKNFVFASSCSVYGAAPGAARRESDDLAPQTAYARSKVGTERALKGLESEEFVVTCLRFATACGMSDRIRLDLVLNDFVACALSSKAISVLSDGSPWRPLIDTTDMARAIEWAITRPSSNGGAFLTVNVGSESWNYQVRDLAHAVAQSLDGITVSINTDAPSDRRSYRVDFSLFSELAPRHQPIMTLQSSVNALIEGLSGMGFSDSNFRQSPFMRLKMLEGHIADGRLNQDLRWNGAGA